MSRGGVTRQRRSQHQPDDTLSNASSRDPEHSIDGCPAELLQTILHNCGRHTRRVSRHWRDTYGPLTFGLYLNNCTSRHDLMRLPPNLASVPTLVIATPTAIPDPRFRPNPHSLITALPRAFPRLTSLDIDARAFPTLTHNTLDPIPLPPLTPLHPHLTALTLRNLRTPGDLASLPAALPLLRSLTCSLDCRDDFEQETLLSAFSTLTALRRLSCSRACDYLTSEILQVYNPVDSSIAFPHLARLPPTLTHLTLRFCPLHLDHTPEDLVSFQAALPNLCSLSLALLLPDYDPGPGPQPDPCPLATLTAALSQRQALTHLDLRLDNHADVHQAGARPLCHLRNLRALEVPNEGDELPVAFLQQVAAASALTSLVWSHLGVAADTHATVTELLTGVAPTLAHLHWNQTVPDYAAAACLSQLSALRSLTLEVHVDRSANGQADVPRTAGALASLTALTQLHFLYCNDQDAMALLRGLSALVSLRQLHLQAADSLPQDMSLLASASTTLTQLRLDCWRYRTTHFLRALRRLPHTVRCVSVYTPTQNLADVIHPWQKGITPQCTERWVASQRRLLADLLPLPSGLRVLALNFLPSLSEGIRNELAAAARRQDCVLECRLPADGRHFGCNGYRC